MKVLNKTVLGALLGASVILTLPASVQADGYNTDRVVVYFTRHAEKQTELMENVDGTFSEVCGTSKCSEILNPKGELRAQLLADWFYYRGITHQLTHAFSSHKTRTWQTIEQIASEAIQYGILSADDVDKFPGDGIQELPAFASGNSGAPATELNPEKTSPSEQLTIDALLSLPGGSVALVAGHSGTIYDIMAGLGLDDVCLLGTTETCNSDRYPFEGADVKVADFGDVWRIILRGDTARFGFRQNLTFGRLVRNNIAR